MEKLSAEELREALKERRDGTLLDLRERELEPVDLSGWDLRGVDFTLSSFQGVILSGADFTGSSVENALFDALSHERGEFSQCQFEDGFLPVLRYAPVRYLRGRSFRRGAGIRRSYRDHFR